jgi:hypothetical protein
MSDTTAPAVVLLIAATFAPLRVTLSVAEAARTAVGDSKSSIRGTTRNPCSTSAAFQVSAISTAARADGMDWLRITAPGPHAQRSVAVPVPVTMSSQ